MVDQERVCCLCGDVGFPEKLFHCSRCRFRFQHSYCSNYYNGSMELSSSSSSSLMCDWCQSEVVGSRSGIISNANRENVHHHHHNLRSEYNGGERIKHNQHQHIKVSSPNNSSTKNSGVPSPRPNSHRRYKLLKDVMC